MHYTYTQNLAAGVGGAPPRHAGPPGPFRTTFVCDGVCSGDTTTTTDYGHIGGKEQDYTTTDYGLPPDYGAAIHCRLKLGVRVDYGLRP